STASRCTPRRGRERSTSPDGRRCSGTCGAPTEAAREAGEAEAPKRSGTYRPWAALLKRTFDVDVLACPTCRGRMKLVAMRTVRESITRYLARIGELTDVPERSPGRDPPFDAVLRAEPPGRSHPPDARQAPRRRPRSEGRGL